jgi:hypothetical protein
MQAAQAVMTTPAAPPAALKSLVVMAVWPEGWVDQSVVAAFPPA